MKIMTPIAEENVRKIHAAGGTVACGTDQSSGRGYAAGVGVARSPPAFRRWM